MTYTTLTGPPEAQAPGGLFIGGQPVASVACPSATLRSVVTYVAPFGGFVAGGALRSIFMGRQPRDYDVFFTSEGGMVECTRRIVSDFPDGGWVNGGDKVWRGCAFNAEVELIGFGTGTMEEVIGGFDFGICMVGLSAERLLCYDGFPDLMRRGDPGYLPKYDDNGRIRITRSRPERSGSRLAERWDLWGLKFTHARTTVGLIAEDGMRRARIRQELGLEPQPPRVQSPPRRPHHWDTARTPYGVDDDNIDNDMPISSRGLTPISFTERRA